MGEKKREKKKRKKRAPLHALVPEGRGKKKGSKSGRGNSEMSLLIIFPLGLSFPGRRGKELTTTKHVDKKGKRGEGGVFNLSRRPDLLVARAHALRKSNSAMSAQERKKRGGGDHPTSQQVPIYTRGFPFDYGRKGKGSAGLPISPQEKGGKKS